ncbi:hypothetical protein J4E93_007968 [Alternaria ventricosa]|uniref:uncharacterized protein n=1 Tax=Alternaria ventricosa TaxID=1187951 RepID=UPI0020C3829B|nr:uncharacterized protein J4E93_007968 [Alternaria ventricosa]KAI4641090.1 hypothetical protein J4E93_007968 [Alternaria ventricosa]
MNDAAAEPLISTDRRVPNDARDRYDEADDASIRDDEVDESALVSPGLTGVISSTLISINTDLSSRPLTTLDKSLITSCTSFFALLASPLTGILADAYGRKTVILVADILFILGALLQAWTSSVGGMIVEKEIEEEEDAAGLRGAPDMAKIGWRAKKERVQDNFSQLIVIGGNRRALVIACMLQGFQQLCGFNSLMYFSATIFRLVGFASPTLTSLSIAITNFLFTLVAFHYIDRIGRRRILLCSVPIMIIGLTLCAVAFLFVDLPTEEASAITATSTTTAIDGDDNKIWPLVILFSMITYVAGYAIGMVILYHTPNPTTMKPTFLLLTTLTTLACTAPILPSTNPPPPLPTAFYPNPASNSNSKSGQMVDNTLPSNSLPGNGIASGQMVDNILPDSDLPGGGIAQTPAKRALANAVPDKYDSSTYYDAAAEKEAEELALVLDAASENAAEDESADTSLNVKRGNGMQSNSVEGCKKRAQPAGHVACLCEKKVSFDGCVQSKIRNYDACAKKECP